MSFETTEVRTTTFPSDEAVETALARLGLSSERIKQVLFGFVCAAPPRDGFGYQQSLARELENYLADILTHDGSLERASDSYSPRLNERADLALEHPGTGDRVFFEVEFRPNVEKDLVKFQIGHNNGRLGIGILIVAIDRTAINRQYTTMPEYAKFVSVIEELRPAYPLLLCGINGRFIG